MFVPSLSWQNDRFRRLKTHENCFCLPAELRTKLGFEQHVVGDCGALSNEYKPGDQDWATSAEDAAAKSMAATTDLVRREEKRTRPPAFSRIIPVI
jgi:hypothetical protein